MLWLLVGASIVLGGGIVAWRLREAAPPPAPPRATATAGPTAPVVAPGSMVRLAAGRVRVGSDDGDPDERPRREVDVAAFELDALEVTVADYRRCVAAGACAPSGPGADCNGAERPSHPVDCVGWDDATAFCAWAGKRLPTELEWEYAARGPEGRTYPWGEAPPAHRACWSGEGSAAGREQRTTCVVGTHPDGATPQGIHDLAGNVWEWTADPYCPYDAPGCIDERRVFRGGGFNNFVSQYLRSADRTRDKPTTRNGNLGFRCARSVGRE